MPGPGGQPAARLRIYLGTQEETMIAKALELRDRGTFIPLLAIDMNPANDAQRYLLRRRGFPCDGRPNIAIASMDCRGDPLWNDPYGWHTLARTYPAAHHWIIDHWDELKDGDVVDVEFILGETPAPKKSEREA